MSTRYNTGNPIESTDVRDMSDNAKNLDLFSNSSDMAFDDRFGVERKTIHGMNSEFNYHILNMGFARIGTFASGATLTNPRQTLLWDIADGGDGQEYGWSGSFLPSGKLVPPGSTPNTTGGIAVGAWISRFDPELRIAVREALRRSYSEAGYALAAGSFQLGGTVTTAKQALLDESTLVAYSWGGTLPKTVPANSTPATSGGISPATWVQQNTNTLRSQLSSPIGPIDIENHRLRDFVSVRDFGAVGDGVTDDSAAFLAAINYLIRVDVGGGNYQNKIFGMKLYIPSGMYEIKSKIAITLNQTRFIILEGDSELTSQISVNNPNGFLDLTCTGRTSTVEINRLGFLAKWGTASSQPGIGRDDFPNSLSDVHDIPSGTAIKITFPAGISTVRSKSLKMQDVIMTGWNRYRGDYFSQGVLMQGGRNPTLVRVVVEGKYGMLLTGRPNELFSNGTALKFVDSYSPSIEDCNCYHYVRGFDLTSVSTDPSFSTSEGGLIVRSAFDAMYGVRVSLPGGEPQFNISNSHINYTRVGIEFQGKNQVHVKDILFYCEASVVGTVARDIVMRGTQKSQITGNIFAKTNTGDRYCISLYKQTNADIPVTSLVVNNNLYWAGATGTFRVYSLSGGGSASNVTIGDGECYENDMAMLFTLGGTDHAAINPIKISSTVAPEGTIWAPLGSLCVVKSTGAMYKKGGTLNLSTGWTLIP